MVQRQSPGEQAALRDLGGSRDKIARLSTHSRVADALRERISEGVFPPGSRLGEEAIAEALGVSRNTVREAFVELAGDRLVVREPNRGVFVATLTAADVIDIFAARRTLETGAVRNGGSPVLVSTARIAVTDGLDAARAGDGAGAATADRHFHRALVGLAGSTRLSRLIRQMLGEIQWVLNAARVSPDLFLNYVTDNERILRKLEAGKSAAAARAMNDVLIRAEHDIVHAISPRQG